MKPAGSKGTWIHRFVIRLFTLVLALLTYWLLGFILQDIQSIKGPDYSVIREKYVEPSLLGRRNALDSEIAALARRIENQQEKQRILGDSSRNLQQTISQILTIRQQGIQRNVTFSQAEESSFTDSMNLFLENQRKYQEMSQTVSEMLDRKQSIENDRDRLISQIKEQEKPAREEYNMLYSRHRVRLAALQLAVLLPVLAVASFFLLRKRGGLYFPLILAFGAATLVRVGVVMHEYFPRRYFKYIITVALLLAVVRLLVHFIRTIAFPKAQWLAKQYREAYERFLCPVCEYPIRIGPRRFLYWTRRTVHKILVPGESKAEEAYTCPSCGSRLFEECPSCHEVRHALLPHCRHCGAEK
jgi:predicted RNA-binding Zn-ribbon protein involved in translation (DUF1610 family)